MFVHRKKKIIHSVVNFSDKKFAYGNGVSKLKSYMIIFYCETVYNDKCIRM